MREWSDDARNEYPRNVLREQGVPARFLELGEVSYIGSGSTADVFRIRGQRDYALKLIRCVRNGRKYENALYEIRMMKRLAGAARIIGLIDSEIVEREEETLVCILEEYCTPLTEYLRDHPVSYSGRVRIVADVCDALIECRKAGVMHLDIQHGNLFVDEEGRIKLSDFSTSLLVGDLYKHKHARGTRSYMAPEVFREGAFSERSEIYSVGMLLYRLMEPDRTRSWSRRERELDNYKRLAGESIPEVRISDVVLRESVMSLICKACAFNPMKRIDSYELLKEELELLIEVIKGSKLDDKAVIVMIDPRIFTFSVSVTSSNHIQIEEPHPPKIPAHQIPGILYSGGSAHLSVDACEERYDHDGDGVCDLIDILEEGVLPALEESEPPGWDDEITEEPPDLVIPSSGDDQCRFCGTHLRPGSKFCCECGMPTLLMKPAIEMQRVSFSAGAPKRFVKKEHTMIRIVVYEKAHRSVVDELNQKLGAFGQEERGGSAKIKEETRLRVSLRAEGIEIPDDTLELIWYGGHLIFPFDVVVPGSYRKQKIIFKANVYADGLLVSRIQFEASCAAPVKQKLKVTRSDIRSAFISYASLDRPVVVRVLQGLRKSPQKLNIFFDQDRLEPGARWQDVLYQQIDTCDVFYLCWSRNASKSEWVEKEWRYAYDKRGEEIIEPIALEHMNFCPPPEELKHKHFDDKMLYYLDQTAGLTYPPSPTVITIGI